MAMKAITTLQIKIRLSQETEADASVWKHLISDALK